MATVSSELAAKVKRCEEFNAEACYHCGVCTAVCPLGYGIMPRKLFRQVMLGLKDKVEEQVPAIYSCLLCRMCESNCPAEVRISENVRALRTLVNNKEL
ncbi:MAG: 4Fe-4S dicluster domain-containing protein [Verrucomicrobia bacterium]|jgi:heterodisulfide reductase subunit C2|nr:4Fe-4S dicluster domain-containing protein [Verrucomicrobiota bacterium]MBT7066390.1 4Fe-4S dicluster domain-containing protein [Verrucomicrobiota bacterium]MBT7701538.1 4Fe-4S dicluster domain-containing protein [Verrucomicrobiota bacterium]